MNREMIDDTDRMLSLEQGRELIRNTSLAQLNDEELKELLVCVKTFCEICFDSQMNRAQAKIIQINSVEDKEETVSEAA